MVNAVNIHPENTTAGFLERLEREVKATGHTFTIDSRQFGSWQRVTVDGYELSLSLTERIGGLYQRVPQGHLTVTIGHRRFSTRKAGWDWPELVAELLAHAERERSERARALRVRLQREAFEEHPDTLAAAKLAKELDVRLDVSDLGVAIRTSLLKPSQAWKLIQALEQIVREGDTKEVT